MERLLPGSYTLEEKIIEGILVTFVVGNLIYCVFDVVFSTYTLLSLSSLLMVVAGSAVWYFIYFKKKFLLLVRPVIIGLLIIHTAIFFLLNGFHSTLALDFINIGFAIVFLFKGKTRIVFLLVYAVNISSLLVVQLFIPSIPDVYDDNVVLDTFIHVLLSGYLAVVIKREYDRSQLTIVAQNHALTEKNNEILTQNEEIAAMNDVLSDVVELRTHELQLKNEKVREYLFLNSHSVRGPLARILGLAELAQDEIPAEYSHLTQYLRKIKESAQEIDSVLYNINQTLSNDDPESQS